MIILIDMPPMAMMDGKGESKNCDLKLWPHIPRTTLIAVTFVLCEFLLCVMEMKDQQLQLFKESMTFLPIKYKSKRNETTKTNVLHKLISIRKKDHLESCTFLIKLTSTFKLLTQALRIFLNNSRLGVDGDEIYTI